MSLTIRNAAADDILSIKRILSQYILETQHVQDNLGQFIVAQVEDQLVGCACLDTSLGVVEMRSIAVLPGWRYKGIGRKMFEILRRRAIKLSDKLFIRTTARDFFEKLGFEALDNSQKPVIWQDCARCDKFQVCLQVPMMLELGSC